MKICLLANPVSLHIQKWANFYAKQGHEVHIIHLKKLFRKSEEISIPGCKIHTIKFLTYFLLNSQYFFTSYQLRKLLKKIQPDILHTHYINYHAWLGAKIGFHPFIATAWGSDIYLEAKNIKRNYKWAKFVFRNADIITTTSPILKEFLIKNYNINPKKLVSFEWGLDFNIFNRNYHKEVQNLKKKLNLIENTHVIFSNRNIKPLYGIHFIIESIPYVIKKYKTVKFIFLRGAGSLVYENKLKARIKELKIEDYIIFIPRLIPAKDLAILDNLADIVISIPNSDQFSDALKEAMVCGAIPILNHLEVYHANLNDGENCYFVNREDPIDVAKKIIYCIDHLPELENLIVKKNIQYIHSNFDWKKNSKLMLEIYEQLKRPKHGE